MYEQPPLHPPMPPYRESPDVAVAEHATTSTLVAAPGDTPDHLLDAFRERLLDARAMGGPLRLLTGLVVALMVAAAVALALHDVAQPHLAVATPGGTSIQVPVSLFIIGMAGLVLVWATLLTGALHGPWYVRFPALAIFTVLTLADAGAALDLSQSAAARAQGFAGTAIIIQLAIVAGVWLRGIVVGIAQVRARRTNPSDRGQRLAGYTFGLVLVGMTVHYAIAYYAAAQAHVLDQLTYTLFSTELAPILVLLLPVIFISGVDFAEIGQATSSRLLRVLRVTRAPWPLAGLTALVAGGVTLHTVFDISAAVGTAVLPATPPALVVGLVVLALLLVVGVLAALVGWGAYALLRSVGQMQRWPRREIPFSADIASAAVFGAAFLVLALVIVGLGLPTVFAEPLGLLLPLGGLVLGLPLIALGRQSPGWFSEFGLMLVAIMTVGFYTLLQQVSHNANIGQLVAPATLIVLVWLLVRGRLNAASAPLLGQLFILNAGLLLLNVLYAYFAFGGSRVAQLGVVQAILLLVAFAWDLLFSGGSTNTDGARFPRYVRLLVHLGYTLLVTVGAVLFSSGVYDEAGALFSHDVTDAAARYGLLVLGTSLLLANFVLHLSRAGGRR